MQEINLDTGATSQWGAAIYAARRDRLRKLLARENIDALLVSQAPNRFYLSGFELHDGQPGESSGYLLVTQAGDDWLATDPRYEETAAQLWPRERIFIYKGGSTATDLARLMNRHCGLAGVETKDISSFFLAALTEKCKNAPCLVAADGLVESLRVIKEPEEITALRKSFSLNHKMLEWVEENLKKDHFSNLAEKDLAWEIEKFFREHGAQELAFATIAALGKNAATPHAIPGSHLITPENLLLIDAGCRVDNYCSDQTRTFWTGTKPDARFIETRQLVQDAQQAALDMMRPGVACADVYKSAREVFAKKSVADAFTHGLGHGVGLQTHEAPSLSPKSRAILEKGMVVTVEPGLYYPAWGGIRWEYTVLVEDNGVSIL